MRCILIVLIAVCFIPGCKKEDNPLTPTELQQLTVKVENDSLIYSLTIPKAVFSTGDSLNARFAIRNKTNNLITFAFDSSDIFYSILNDSGRTIMSYPKQFNAHGFFAALPQGDLSFTIIDQLYDDLNIPIRAGSYQLSVRVENPKTPTLRLNFSVK